MDLNESKAYAAIIKLINIGNSFNGIYAANEFLKVYGDIYQQNSKNIYLKIQLLKIQIYLRLNSIHSADKLLNGMGIKEERGEVLKNIIRKMDIPDNAFFNEDYEIKIFELWMEHYLDMNHLDPALCKLLLYSTLLDEYRADNNQLMIAGIANVCAHTYDEDIDEDLVQMYQLIYKNALYSLKFSWTFLRSLD